MKLNKVITGLKLTCNFKKLRQDKLLLKHFEKKPDGAGRAHARGHPSGFGQGAGVGGNRLDIEWYQHESD